MLQIGTKAPEIQLHNHKGELVKLSDYIGKRIVLYFYPKDNTPGCTKQACGYRDHYEEFLQRDVIVMAISKDGVKSHANFVTKHELPFHVLSDPELDAIQAYDVWQEKKLYGKVSMGVVRTTYVINEEGIIEQVNAKVKAADDANHVLTYLNGAKETC